MTTLSDAETRQRDDIDAVQESVESNRAVWRRESAILIALALIGIAIEFAPVRSLKFSEHPEIGRAIPVVAIMLGLTSLVPFAIRITPGLGLPGVPLIAARLAGEKLHFRFRSLLKISVGYAVLGLLLSGAVRVLELVFVPKFMANPNAKSLIPYFTKLAPSRIAIVGLLFAIAAGVCEEIQFRLVLFAVFARILRRVTPQSSGPSSRSALWFVTILQAYAFGMLHLFRLAAQPHVEPMLQSVPSILVAGLMVPQTWGGIVLGRLYLRRGLEASMLAHVILDGALFELIAILVLLIQALLRVK